MHGDPAVAPRPHCREGVGRRQVCDVHRHAGSLGQGDGPRGRLALQPRRPAVRVLDGSRPSGRHQTLDEEVDRPAVLGVHGDQGSELAGPGHRPEQRPVVDEIDAGIGHEELERGHSRRDEIGHLRQHPVVHLAQHHVEAVVHVRPAIGARHPAFEPHRRRLAVLVPGVVDDRGGAAPGSRLGAGGEVVAGDPCRGHQPQVRVHVDPARDDVAADRGDDVVGGPEVGADGDHLLVDDQDVGAHRVARGHDGAAGDQGPHHTSHTGAGPSEHGPLRRPPLRRFGTVRRDLRL